MRPAVALGISSIRTDSELPHGLAVTRIQDYQSRQGIQALASDGVTMLTGAWMENVIAKNACLPVCIRGPEIETGKQRTSWCSGILREEPEGSVHNTS